jgi:hypothetical protein
MTDEEFARLMQQLGPAGAGLASPSQIEQVGATQRGVSSASILNPEATGSSDTLGPQFAISGKRETVTPFPTDTPAAQGTTGAIMSVLAPDKPQISVDSSALTKAIDESMAYHQQRAAEQQQDLTKAFSTLGDIDATDSAKEKAHATIQDIPTRMNRDTGNLEPINPVPTQGKLLEALTAQYPEIPADRWTPKNLQQVQRDQFVANITPAQTPEGAAAARYANLNTGLSARALQDLGLEFPGVTGKYATAPVFQPDAPGPAQKIERAQPVPIQRAQPVTAADKILSGVDSRIPDIIANAARGLPAGYTVQPTSGMRSSGQGQHTVGKAADYQIIGPDGNPVPNRGDDASGLYTQLARNAYGYQESKYPELTGQFQWGGQFGTSSANPNQPDLMHFDIGGRRGRISKYSRENIGATLPPDASNQTSTTGQTSVPGLTTVRGTEFGQIDNPTRGGYTEAGWNVGAWGGDLADTKSPFVALPPAILGNYGNPNDKDFADKFNSKYDIQVVDPKTGKVVVSSLRDKGPGAKTGAGIDMSWATREQLGLQPNFSGDISYRVVPKGTGTPDSTTASVQQTQANAGGTAASQFTPGATPDRVYIKPIDPGSVKDPWTHGSTMTTADIALWARHQANEYASQMDAAGMPLRMDAYQAQFQKFFEAGQKYQNTDIKLEPVSEQHNDQFNSLAALVSKTGSVDENGTPTSQLDLLAKSFAAAKDAHPLGGMYQFPPQQWGAYDKNIAMYKAQAEHLVTNVARGVQSQSGNLSDTEQNSARQLLPQEGDSKEVGLQKIAMLKATIQDQMRRVIQLNKAEHRDTTGLEQLYRQNFVKSKEQEVAEQAANTSKTRANLTANLPANQPSKKNPGWVKGGPPQF